MTRHIANLNRKGLMSPAHVALLNGATYQTVETSTVANTSLSVSDHAKFLIVDLGSSHHKVTLPDANAVGLHNGWYTDIFFDGASDTYAEDYIQSHNDADNHIYYGVPRYGGATFRHYTLGGEIWRVYFVNNLFHMFCLQQTPYQYKIVKEDSSGTWVNLTNNAWSQLALDENGAGVNDGVYNSVAGAIPIIIPVVGTYIGSLRAQARGNAAADIHTWLASIGDDTSNPFDPFRNHGGDSHSDNQTFNNILHSGFTGVVNRAKTLEPLLYNISQGTGDPEYLPSGCVMEIEFQGRV